MIKSFFLHETFSFLKCHGNPKSITSVIPHFPRVFPRDLHVPSSSSSSSRQTELFKVSSEVREAIRCNNPVVALESAIITHGMPYPENIEVALRLEEIMREEGVVPATVGVVKGTVQVGLSQNEIEMLGSWRSHQGSLAVKVSRRDLPFVATHKLNGGTTVAGTIIAAVKAGIPIFATGGLGGVHRGAETTFDISADLKELGRNPIGVVSAGVKSILDIGKTLEYMETEGICVAVLDRGNTSLKGGDETLPVSEQISRTKFPSFFTPQSSFTAPYCVRSELEASHLLLCSFELELNSGLLIAVPIPEEEGSSLGETIENAIREALELAERNGVKGKEVTPFLLKEVNRLTGGLSLIANKLLIENNVRVACQIAHNLSQLRRSRGGGGDFQQPKSSGSSIRVASQQTTKPGIKNGRSSEEIEKHDRPVVIGGTSLDLVLAIQEDEIVEDGRTHQTSIRTYPGGVARNHAEALAKLNLHPILISAIGDDLFGRELLHQFQAIGLDHSRIKVTPSNLTAVYAGVLKKTGECAFGMGDMGIHDEISSDDIVAQKDLIQTSPIVVLDANVSLDVIITVLKLCKESGTKIWFETTEVRKASKICEVPRELLSAVTYMSPNSRELENIVKGLGRLEIKAKRETRADHEDLMAETCFQLFPGLETMLLTKGKDGIKVVHRNSKGSLEIESYPAPELDASKIRSVSGAGDNLNAGFISGLLRGLPLEFCAKLGLQCAKQSLFSLKNVPDTFQNSPEAVN